MTNRWTITLDEDPETGDLVMPFPPDMLAELGWKEGDTLTWNVDSDSGHITLSKKASD